MPLRLTVVLLLGAAFIGCGDDEPETPSAPATPAPTKAPEVTKTVGPRHPPSPRGKELYVQHCALCHGENGEGYKADHANALGNQDFLSIVSDGFLRIAIDEGRPGTPMSAWSTRRGGPLNPAQVNDIVRHIRSWQTEPSIPAGPARVLGQVEPGRKIFQDKCASCHGVNGAGATAVSLNNPWFLTLIGDGYLKHTIQHGRRGTPMLGFASTLSESDIENVVTLIRSWEERPQHGHEHDPSEAPPRFNRPTINPRGRHPTFTLRDERYVPADQVKAALDKGQRMVIVDARPPSDWLREHIRGSIPLPFYAIESHVDTLPNDGTWIIAYCACPHAASGKVVEELRERGFEHTAVLDEGMPYWVNKGYPTRSGNRR